MAGAASNAGLLHCGPTSAYFFKVLKEDGKPETFIIIGDNHYSLSDRWHLHPSRYWQTPIGIAVIDDELTDAMKGTEMGLAMARAAKKVGQPRRSGETR